MGPPHAALVRVGEGREVALLLPLEINPARGLRGQGRQGRERRNVRRRRPSRRRCCNAGCCGEDRLRRVSGLPVRKPKIPTTTVEKCSYFVLDILEVVF